MVPESGKQQKKSKREIESHRVLEILMPTLIVKAFAYYKKDIHPVSVKFWKEKICKERSTYPFSENLASYTQEQKGFLLFCLVHSVLQLRAEPKTRSAKIFRPAWKWTDCPTKDISNHFSKFLPCFIQYRMENGYGVIDGIYRVNMETVFKNKTKDNSKLTDVLLQHLGEHIDSFSDFWVYSCDCETSLTSYYTDLFKTERKDTYWG